MIPLGTGVFGQGCAEYLRLQERLKPPLEAAHRHFLETQLHIQLRFNPAIKQSSIQSSFKPIFQLSLRIISSQLALVLPYSIIAFYEAANVPGRLDLEQFLQFLPNLVRLNQGVEALEYLQGIR